MKKIVIIGAGFGGLTAAKTLAKHDFEITIIDKTNHLGPVRTYKFTGVDQNHTIMAKFNKIIK